MQIKRKPGARPDWASAVFASNVTRLSPLLSHTTWLGLPVLVDPKACYYSQNPLCRRASGFAWRGTDEILALEVVAVNNGSATRSTGHSRPIVQTIEVE